jgi:hypothetical protein
MDAEEILEGLVFGSGSFYVSMVEDIQARYPDRLSQLTVLAATFAMDIQYRRDVQDKLSELFETKMAEHEAKGATIQ